MAARPKHCDTGRGGGHLLPFIPGYWVNYAGGVRGRSGK